MKAKALKDLSVLSISEGQRLGRVRDVLYDPQARRVAALVVEPASGGGLFGGGRRHYILFGAIESIGDAVTVGSAQAILQEGETESLAGLPSLDDVDGTKVVDTTGHLVGTVEGVEIDPANGTLAALRVRQGGVLGLGGHTYEVPAESVHSLGSDAIMVEPLPAAS